MLLIWPSVLWRLEKLFRTTLGVVRTSCVFSDIRVLNSKLFTGTGWVFRQWLDPQWGYLHEDSDPLHDFLPFPEFHACGQWGHVMLSNYVLLHVKCHKTHMQSEGGVDIVLSPTGWPQVSFTAAQCCDWLIRSLKKMFCDGDCHYNLCCFFVFSLMSHWINNSIKTMKR